MTLHDAMAKVLREKGHGMTPKELSDEIANRGLYVRKDGGHAPGGQISARVNRYQLMFDKQDGKIFLR